MGPLSAVPPLIAQVRQAMWVYGCCMNISAGCSPPTSLVTEVGRRGDHVGQRGSDGHIGRVLTPHPFCLGSILEVLTVVIFRMFILFAFKHRQCKSFCPSSLY